MTARPELVIGMHFMNPVPLMKLIEIVRGLQTSDATYDGRHGRSRSRARQDADHLEGPPGVHREPHA